MPPEGTLTGGKWDMKEIFLGEVIRQRRLFLD